MELLLHRKWKKEKYTIGDLYIDGIFFSNTIEDRDRGLDCSMSLNEIKRKKVYGETAIPTGSYPIDMDTVSTKFRLRDWARPYGGKLPRLLGVPYYSGVLIHPGNTAEDSLGCILVGENKVKGKVINSAKTFARLMDEHLVPAHNRGEEIWINIV